MTEFIQAVFALPTVLFTVPLALSVLYWLLVILGAVDLEGLDGAVDGAFDAGLDGLFDGAAEALDGAFDAGIDGALDGAAEALDGAADSVDASLDGSGSLVLDVLNALHLRDVPMTVSLSILTLYGWVLSYLVTPLVPASALAFAAVGLAALTGGTLGASITVRPLGRFFETHEGRGNRHFVGTSCVITTGRVDPDFGQATLQMDGDALLVQVRTRTANVLRKGDEALVVHYDRLAEVFVVEPLGEA